MSTMGTGSSPFSGDAKGVVKIAMGMEHLLETSGDIGGAVVVTRTCRGEQLAVSIATKLAFETGGTFLVPCPARVW